MLKAISRYSKHIASALSGQVPALDSRPLPLFVFDSQREVDRWHVFTDTFFGGKSHAELRLAGDQKSLVFQGHCTVDQDGDAEMKRAGYCCATSKVIAIGDYFDLERYSHLVYAVRGDGRSYIANVRTDSMSGGSGDVWQAPFHTRKEEWLEVRIPFSSFVMTHQGQLVGHRHWLPNDRVISIGVAVSVVEEQEQRQQQQQSGLGGREMPAGQAIQYSKAAPEGVERSRSSSSSRGADLQEGAPQGGRVDVAGQNDAPLGFDFCLEIQGIKAESDVDLCQL